MFGIYFLVILIINPTGRMEPFQSSIPLPPFLPCFYNFETITKERQTKKPAA